MITIFGSAGFIGSNLTAGARARGLECFTPARGDESWRGRHLGHVVYAAGVTADFRQRPFDTVRAHVAGVADVLEGARYDTFVYLSSTRLYSGTARAEEETSFFVDPRSFSDLYNLSKLTGEALVLSQAGPRARVVRLSNVYGGGWSSGNFLVSLIRDAVCKGKVVIGTSPQSCKDYIAIDDVVPLLLDIALRGRHTIYNVASGQATSNADLAAALRVATGREILFAVDAPTVTFPQIDVTRIRTEFGGSPRSILADLPALVSEFRKVEES